MPNRFVELLDPQRVALNLRAQDKDAAVRELVPLLARTRSAGERDELIEMILEREKTSSTLAENGVAFPHARSEICGGLVLAIGRSVAGVPWNENGDRAHLIFLLCVPRKLINDYLVVIGAIARATRDDALRTLLLHAENIDDFLATLRDAQSI